MHLTFNMGTPRAPAPAPRPKPKKKELQSGEQNYNVDTEKDLGSKKGAAQTLLGFGMLK